jgi:hypothetical protein
LPRPSTALAGIRLLIVVRSGGSRTRLLFAVRTKPTILHHGRWLDNDSSGENSDPARPLTHGSYADRHQTGGQQSDDGISERRKKIDAKKTLKRR